MWGWPQTYQGMRVRLNPGLVESELVALSWRERLTSLRPWIKTRVITRPISEVYIVNGEAVMHPRTWEALKNVC